MSWISVPTYSHGLYSYGLYTYGLYSHGLHSYGLSRVTELLALRVRQQRHRVDERVHRAGGVAVLLLRHHPPVRVVLLVVADQRGPLDEVGVRQRPRGVLARVQQVRLLVLETPDRKGGHNYIGP